MPCYQLVLFARPDMTAERLAALYRMVARVVYREHGQFRNIQNFGVRPLAFPVRKNGQKYEEVRWVHANFDIAPSSLPAVSATVTSDKAVLQFKYIRNTDYLGEFKPAGARVRLKPFSAAMRYNQDIFDPDSLTIRATGSEGAMAAAGSALAKAKAAAVGKSTEKMR